VATAQSTAKPLKLGGQRLLFHRLNRPASVRENEICGLS
jgi:hypothetical protein